MADLERVPGTGAVDLAGLASPADAIPDLPTHVMLRFEFTCADGTMIEREWTAADIEGREGTSPPPDLDAGPPSWLDDYGKRWENPRDPVTFYGVVEEGHEDEAREWLGLTESDDA